MRCLQCGHENPVDMKFCGECGTRLAVLCRECGVRNGPTQKFCGECGARLEPGASPRQLPSPDAYTPKHLAEKILTSKTALEGERKQVTVLFADLKGSMELLADRDPEDARKLLDPVQSASSRRSSGWPITPYAARCGRKRSPISARRGYGPWRGGPIVRPLPTWSRRSWLSAVCRGPGRRPS